MCINFRRDQPLVRASISAFSLIQLCSFVPKICRFQIADKEMGARAEPRPPRYAAAIVGFSLDPVSRLLPHRFGGDRQSVIDLKCGQRMSRHRSEDAVDGTGVITVTLQLHL